jgi:transposase InsO family protein
VRFGFIRTEKANYPVPVLCRVLEVSRSGFYAWCRREPSERARQDEKLRVEIRATHAVSRRTYGSPRIQSALAENGLRVSRKRVARLMAEEGLQGQQKRRFRVTTNSKHSFPVAPNLLQRDFTAFEPNQVWVSDITYIWTWEGWLYLAVILDLFSRRVVGWALDSRIDTTLALEALQVALRTRSPEAGTIHHSDRGVQYAAEDYQAKLAAHGLVCSMSRKGDCWDNAVAESFFSTFKTESVPRGGFVSRAQARATTFEYIEVFYNCLRSHTTIGSVSPVDFESNASWRSAVA